MKKRQSESIVALAAALVKAQAQMGGAKKTAKNPFFKSNYSTLEEVINCVKEPLNSNGIFYNQNLITKNGQAGANTRFIHESGEWLLSDDFFMQVVKNDPQGYGSAFTYAKRYSLQSACGLPNEDDDGNAATGNQSGKAKVVAQSTGITQTQKSSAVSLISAAGFTPEQGIKAITWASNARTKLLDELTTVEAAKLIGFVQQKVDAA